MGVLCSLSQTALSSHHLVHILWHACWLHFSRISEKSLSGALLISDLSYRVVKGESLGLLHGDCTKLLAYASAGINRPIKPQNPCHAPCTRHFSWNKWANYCSSSGGQTYRGISLSREKCKKNQQWACAAVRICSEHQHQHQNQHQLNPLIICAKCYTI